jgi:GxxExxY protein
MSADFLYKEETGQILGCSFEVHKIMPRRQREKAYERALVREFQLQSIPYDQQKQYPVFYKDTQVDVFIPDLIAFEKIVVDTKTIPQITDHERAQICDYLRITGLKVGLILNFKNASLEYRRVILTPQKKPPSQAPILINQSAKNPRKSAWKTLRFHSAFP